MLSLSLSSFAGPASAKTIAVLDYRDDGLVTDETVNARTGLGNGVRAALPPFLGDDVILDANLLRERLRGPMGPPLSLVAVKTTLAAADEATGAVEHERAVGLFESAITQLQTDSNFSLEKRELLQLARLRCARLLVGLAGPTETGGAETPQGQRARGHLENALRIDPTLVLDPSSTSPKMRALLGLASERLKASGHGGMTVVSMPAGATVYLDGRALGLTPMTTAADSIPWGQYRLWLATTSSPTVRSFARVVEVGELPLEIDINVVSEGAIDAAVPGLVRPLRPLVPLEIRHLASVAGAEEFVVVGESEGQGFVVVFDGNGTLVRSGVVGADVDADNVARFIAAMPSSVTEAPAPAALYSLTLPAAGVGIAAANDDGGEFPVAAVAIGAGIVGVIAAGAATVGVLWLTRSERETMNVALELR